MIICFFVHLLGAVQSVVLLFLFKFAFFIKALIFFFIFAPRKKKKKKNYY